MTADAGLPVAPPWPRDARAACAFTFDEHVRHTPRVWTAPLAEISAHVRGAA